MTLPQQHRLGAWLEQADEVLDRAMPGGPAPRNVRQEAADIIAALTFRCAISPARHLYRHPRRADVDAVVDELDDAGLLVPDIGRAPVPDGI